MDSMGKQKTGKHLQDSDREFDGELLVLVQLFSNVSRRACDLSEVVEALEPLRKRLGITNVFSAFLPGRNEKLTDYIRLRGWNAAWLDDYDGRNFVHGDPVVRFARKSSLPFLWSEALALTQLGKAEQKILSQAKSFGYLDGYTVQFFGPRMKTAIVTFGTDGRNLAGYERDALDVIAHRLNEWLVKNVDIESRPTHDEIVPLSPQEIEIVYHLMKGEKNKQIAFYTGLSKRTVEGHAMSARLKLKAGNSLELVVRALRLGFIHLE